MKGIIAFACVFISSLTLANDGYIAFGGSPKLLSGHRSIAMESEVVKVDAYDNWVYVVADFTFHNRGAACKVRMGFPDDDSSSAYDDRRKAINAKLKPALTRLKRFRSWVDGKTVKTTLIQGPIGTSAWHAKTVSFARNQRRKVRVTYRVETGGGFLGTTSDGKFYRHQNNAHYVTTTGASWRGKLGHSKVIVRVRSKDLLLPFDAHKAEEGSDLKQMKKPQRVAIWHGFTKPKIYGRVFVFERRNFEPDDDVSISWMTRFKSPVK